MATSSQQVLGILDLLDDFRPILGGGWGVDALVGHQTRDHHDIDLALDALDLDAAVHVLQRAGYTVTTDWLPARIELTSPEGAVVDLHPVTWGADGNGVQQGLDGDEFSYATDEIVTGHIEGRGVRCISVQLQRRFHSGYEHSDIDRLDLAQLDQLS